VLIIQTKNESESESESDWNCNYSGSGWHQKHHSDINQMMEAAITSSEGQNKRGKKGMNVGEKLSIDCEKVEGNIVYCWRSNQDNM